MHNLMKRRWTLFTFVMLFASAHAWAQDIQVMSSGGFAAAYKALVPQFQTEKQLNVSTVWGPSMGTTPGAIPVRLSHGEPADVVIMARGELDGLAKRGLVVDGSQVDLAYSRIGMAVKAGTPAPDISSVDAFRRTLLNAKSVAYSDSASGVYIAAELFKRLGIEKEMQAKARQIPAEPVGQVVARGEAELGFQQLSELKPVPGIMIVGPIPEELQKVTVFSAGVVAKSERQEAARNLIRYLASASACDAIKQTSLDPATCMVERK